MDKVGSWFVFPACIASKNRLMKAWAHESMGFNPSPVADKDILSALAT